jgi:hypothetical protein
MKNLGLLLLIIVVAVASFLLGSWLERQSIISAVTVGPDSDNIGPALRSVDSARTALSEGDAQGVSEELEKVERHFEAIDQWFDKLRDEYR